MKRVIPLVKNVAKKRSSGNQHPLPLSFAGQPAQIIAETAVLHDKSTYEPLRKEVDICPALHRHEIGFQPLELSPHCFLKVTSHYRTLEERMGLGEAYMN